MGEVDYIRRAERALYSYHALIAAMENEIELEREGFGNLYPSMTAHYGGTGGGRSSEVSKPTERFGILRAEKSVQIRQIQRALGCLVEVERQLVDMKYFNPRLPRDPDVYKELGLGATAYYRVKRQAMRKIAIALNII